MYVTISLTGTKEKVLEDLAVSSQQSNPAAQKCEDAIRRAIGEYVIESAKDGGGVGVSSSISVSYDAK